jgi:hypothetical protein
MHGRRNAHVSEYKYYYDDADIFWSFWKGMDIREISGTKTKISSAILDEYEDLKNNRCFSLKNKFTENYVKLRYVFEVPSTSKKRKWDEVFFPIGCIIVFGLKPIP